MPNDPSVDEAVQDRDTGLFDAVVNLCKRRGFVFPSAEIYGGIRSTYDYGPLGALMLRNVQARPGGVRWSKSATTSSPSTPPSSPTRRSGRPPGTWRPSPTRSSTAATATSAGAPTSSRRLTRRPGCPNCGSTDLTEARPFNLMFKTFVGPGRGRGVRRLPAPGDRPGHVRQLRERHDDDAAEAAVRHRADRPELPQRDHAGQLRLPHPRVRADGDRVLRPARREPAAGSSTGATERFEWYRATASRPRSCACASTTPKSSRTTRPGPPTSSSTSRGAGASWRASPTAPTST